MPASKPHSWKVGDIVMAPGDCACATLSKIVRIVGNKAFMSSAHDYTGWVFVRQIRLRKVKKGQAIKLYQRSPGGGHNIHDGTVLDSTDEQVRVIHDISQEEPGKKEWVPWRAIGIPCDPLGPACLPEDEFAFYDQLAPGTRVWAPWESSRLYSGTVTQVKGGDVHVRLDRGASFVPARDRSRERNQPRPHENTWFTRPPHGLDSNG